MHIRLGTVNLGRFDEELIGTFNNDFSLNVLVLAESRLRANAEAGLLARQYGYTILGTARRPAHKKKRRALDDSRENVEAFAANCVRDGAQT